MSDDDSFEILGSSPCSSLEYYHQIYEAGAVAAALPINPFLIIGDENDLVDAVETEVSPTHQQDSVKTESQRKRNQYESEEMDVKNVRPLGPKEQKLNLEDCFFKCSIDELQHAQTTNGNIQQQSPESTEWNIQDPILTAKNIDTYFSMDEIFSDNIKSTVYAKFPSIAKEASEEDIIKLEAVIKQHDELKDTVFRANSVMKLFYKDAMEFKQRMITMEEKYKQHLDNCQNQIEELRKKHKEVENAFQMQLEAAEIARREDRNEYVKEISEKKAVLENMRAEINKLMRKESTGFESMLTNHDNHECKSKIERRDFAGIKANLKAATDDILNNRSDITNIHILDKQRQLEIQSLQDALKSLQLAYEEQKERIVLLETQTEIYRADFAMEKQSRETAIKEKHELLRDLRAKHKQNQDLIEKHQKMAEVIRNKVSAGVKEIKNTQKITDASAAAQKHFIKGVAPIRALPSYSGTNSFICPICNTRFQVLGHLLDHVNSCVGDN